MANGPESKPETRPEAKAAPRVAETAKVAEVRRLAQGMAAPSAAARTMDETTKQVQQTMEKTMEQVNKAAENIFKVAEDVAEFGRGNVEAFTKAAQAYVAGVQDLGRQSMAIVQGLTDHALEGAKALAAVKSLQEAAQVQANYARTTIEKVVADGAKLQETALKVAEASFAPLSARMTAAVEKFARPIAA